MSDQIDKLIKRYVALKKAEAQEPRQIIKDAIERCKADYSALTDGLNIDDTKAVKEQIENII